MSAGSPLFNVLQDPLALCANNEVDCLDFRPEHVHPENSTSSLKE